MTNDYMNYFLIGFVGMAGIIATIFISAIILGTISGLGMHASNAIKGRKKESK